MESTYINKRSKFLFLLLIFTTLHTLRNLSSLYLIVLIILFFLNYFIIVTKSKKLIFSNPIEYKFYFFLLLTFIVGITSPLHFLSFDSLFQFPRLFLMPFLTYLMIQSNISFTTFIYFIKWFIFLILLGAFSLLFQVLTGQSIYWFNVGESSRGGLFRFGTILGSLTIYGTIVGNAILILFDDYFKKFKLRIFFLAFLLIGAILSLQKAALLNIFIGFIFINLARNNFFNLIKWVFYFLFFLFIVYLFMFFNQNTIFTNYFATIIFQVTGFEILNFQNIVIDNGAMLSENSIFDRLYGYAFDEMFEVYNPFKTFFLGNGLVGAGGAMGLDGPQSHNSFWDLFFIGGFLFLFSFITLFFEVQSQLYKCLQYNLASSLFWSNWLFFINCFVSSISMFHPVLSLPFWLSIIYIINFKKNIKFE